MDKPTATSTRMLMGTFVSIEVIHKDKSLAEHVINEAFQSLHTTEHRLSRFIETSEITEINTHAFYRDVTLSPELFGLLNFCQSLHHHSNSLFDITMGPWIDLWRNHQGQTPKDEEVIQCRSRIGAEHVQLNQANQSIRLHQNNMCLDLGAIGKGFALDQLPAIWTKYGIEDASVNLGGQISAWHSCAQNYSIANPLCESKILHSVQLTQNTIATSSNAQNELPHGHLLQPSTGQSPPDTDKLVAVSIVASQATVSDALSTAVFLLGEKQGTPLALHYGATEVHCFYHKPLLFLPHRVTRSTRKLTPGSYS